jgi:D-Tyr-tRNAtyr deacylase
MGNWNINIQGVGSHHNTDNPTDANKMAEKFVKELKDAGHHVETATFTFGAKNNLTEAKPLE